MLIYFFLYFLIKRNKVLLGLKLEHGVNKNGGSNNVFLACKILALYCHVVLIRRNRKGKSLYMNFDVLPQILVCMNVSKKLLVGCLYFFLPELLLPHLLNLSSGLQYIVV
jgi:hypothetical protein